MNFDGTKPAEYVVYVSHESTSAATGFQSTTASPTSLSSIIRNRSIVIVEDSDVSDVFFEEHE